MGNEGHETGAMAQAVAWHLRLPTAAAADWTAFTDWLEADPAHAYAYDSLACADAALDDALMPADWSAPLPLVADNDDRPTARRWTLAGLVAAGAAAGIIVVMLPLDDPATAARIVETPAGVRRAIVLADGSRVELNGGTRLAITEGQSRLVTLERGEAVFRVTHDAAHPFVVQSGTMRLQDVGTVFNVARVGPHLGVQVAEGAVMFQPEHERIMLTAGAALSHVDGQGARMSGIAVEDVGSWRRDRLVFRQTPVRLVAAALERSTGASVRVAAGLGETPFTGSIRTGDVTGGADRIITRAAALIGMRAVHAEGRWTLVGGGHAGP